MAMNMKDFLTLYFRQLHFDKMSEAQKSQFDGYVAKDDFRGDMKSWRDDLLKKDASGNLVKGKDGHYVHNDLPDGLNGDTKMEGKDWSDLYMALYNAFVAMNNDKESFASDKDKDRDGVAAVKFLNEYFGDGKVFEPVKLDNNVKNKINGLLTTIHDSSEQNSGDDLYTLLKLNGHEIKQLNNLIGKPNDFDKPENRELIEKLVQNLSYELQYGDNIDQESPLFKDVDLQSIRNALYQEKEPTTADLSRLQSRYKDILNDLHNKPKVFNIFKEYDKSKISKALNSALENTDYNGKTKEANFVKPKYDDTLNWKEKLEKNTKDLYNDTLKKYLSAHRDHVYVLPTAKTIGDIITGLKDFNPNDSLDKILKNNKDAIIDKLQDKQPLKSLDHFKWFAETIENFQKRGKSKEIEGALRDGDKMNHLVEDLAIKAIEDGKVEEAKTAMEVLKVMQQPFFSGRAMDAIRKTDFTLFSDPGLSFNKSNSTVQSVMNAVDKTIGATIKGVALAGTGLASLYNRRNLGLHKTGKLEEGHKAHEQEKELFAQEQENLNLEDDARILDAYQEQQKTGIKDKTELAKKEKLLENAKKRLEKLNKEKEKADKQFEAYEKIVKDFEKRNKLKKDNDAQADIVKGLNEKLEGMPGEPQTQRDAFDAEKTKGDFDSELKKLQEIATSLEDADKEYGSFADLEKEYKKIKDGGPNSIYEQAKANKDNLAGAVEKKETQIFVLEQKISKYKEMDAQMDFYEKAINQRNEKVAKWDEDNKDYYYELMGFWDFLQTGSTKNIFKLSTKKLQKQMDNGQMAKIYNDWMHSQGYSK